MNSEDEGRNKLKRFSSLRATLGHIDRQNKPVGNLNEITTKAKAIAQDGLDVLSEEDDDSQYDNGIESVKGDIEPTEDNPPFELEEAKNVIEPTLQIEEEMPKKTTLEPIEEDLTTPEAILYLDEVPDWDERMERANYTQP